MRSFEFYVWSLNKMSQNKKKYLEMQKKAESFFQSHNAIQDDITLVSNFQLKLCNVL
jgi:hypothetical protein